MVQEDERLADETPAAGSDIPTTGPMTREEEAALDDEVLGELEEIEVDETRGGQRPVSVIFASISGFETDSSMNQDEIEEIAIRKSGFDAALDTVIHRYGGTIDKIIRGFFMATFGTQTATKEDPVLAVLAAKEMTTAAEEYGAEIHVGVNAGHAWVGQIRTERTIDTTVIGGAVNLAARLKTQAGHNEVVVSPATYDLTKEYFEYEELRELPPGTLKGIDRPMTIYRPGEPTQKATLIRAIRQDDAARLAALEESIPEYLREKILNGQSRLQGERKMVTLLYSDVSGFTALSEMYADNPELIAEVMNRCHKRLGDIVYKYEGVVDKLVGDEIMAIFGAPIIHEDDPERAIECAIEMQREMDKVSEEVQRELNVPPLSVHIGINTGRVSIGNLIPGSTRMDYTVIGEPTELAEELEDCSEGGEIVVGQRTYRLTRALFDFEERPPIKIGDREIPIYLVRGKKDVVDSKRGLQELGDIPMIGREPQFEQAKQCIERTFAGESPIVTIIGEAGFGKSRLKREMASIVRDRGGTWIEGACFSQTQGQGYSVFLRALEAQFGLKDNDSPADRRLKLEQGLNDIFDNNREAIDEVLPYLGNMLSITFEGALAEKIAYLDPEQLQRRTFVAMRDLFLTMSRRQPVVVALDDLHWVDNLSNDLIYFLFDNIDEAPVLLLNVYRPERRDLCWQIGETASTKYPDRYETIQIDPLSPEAARQLLDLLLPMREEGEPLKEMLLEKADGNPFYLEEFIRVLLDDDFIERQEDIWILKKPVSEFEVPDTLEQMLSARIDKLDDASKDVLQSAAVVGRQFEHDVLGDAVEDQSDLDDCLNYLTDLDFVHEAQPDPLAYVFGHIVTYEISYNAIVSGRRRILHGRVGGSYESRHPGDLERFLELLAYHFSESTEKPKALHYNGAAGSKARRMFNNKDAVTFYERGLEFVDQIDDPDPADVLEILDGLGDVYSALGRYDDSIGAINRALEMTDDPFRRAVFQRKLGGVYTKWGKWDTAEEHLETALGTLDGLDDTGEKRVEEARIYNMEGFCSFSQGQYPAGNERCSRALQLVENTDALDVLASVYKNLGNVNMRIGNTDQAMSYYQEGIEIAKRIGDKLLESQLYNNLAAAKRLLARTEEAIQDVRRSIELAEQMAYADGLTTRYALLGTLQRQQGNVEDAIQTFRAGIEIAEKAGAAHRIAIGELSLGACYAWMKDHEQAIEHYRRALDLSREGNYREGEMAALMNLCDSSLSLGADHLEDAERYSREAAEVAEAINLMQGIIAARKNIGVVYWRQNRLNEALDAFRTALESAQAAKVTNAEAEIYRNMGDVYLEIEDATNAREHLTKAAELFEQLGSTDHAAEIRRRIPDA